MDQVRGLFPRVIRSQSPLRVPVELHQLVTDLQDAINHLWTVAQRSSPENREEYLDAYAALSMRRKELYEYVIERTPRTREYNALYINF